MKLPGINYNLGVQSLGRADTSAPGRQWAANQQVRDATTGVLGAVAKVTDNVAKSESNAAINVYNQKMNEFLVNGKWADQLDENGKPSIKGGLKNYAAAEAEARRAAEKSMSLGLGTTYFKDRADERNVLYSNNWNSALKTWDTDERVAVSNQLIQTAFQEGNFDAGFEQLDLMVDSGLMNATAAQKQRVVMTGDMKAIQYSHGIESATVQDDYIKIRKQIDEDEFIQSDPQLAERYNAMLDNKIINNDAEYLREQLTVIANTDPVNGPQLASVAAQERLAEIHKASGESVDGLRDDARRSYVNALQSVANDFVMKAQESGAFTSRMAKIDESWTMQGTTKDSWVRSSQNEGMKILLGAVPSQKGSGWDKEVNFDQVLSSTPEGFEHRQRLLDHYKNQGYILPITQKILDAGFTAGSSNPQMLANAIDLVDSMTDYNPGNMTWDTISFPKNYKDIIRLNSGDSQAAFAEIMRQKNIDPKTKEYNQAAFSAYTSSKDFDDNFDDIMESLMPADGIAWTDAVPGYSLKYKQEILDIARNKIDIVGMEPEQAIRESIVQKQGVVSFDPVTNKVQARPFSSLVESKGNNASGEWAHNQLKLDMAEYLDVNIGDVPTYNYFPVSNFNPEKPSYIVTYTDPKTSMLKQLPEAFYPHFSSTPEGYEAGQAQLIRMEEEKRQYNYSKGKACVATGTCEATNVPFVLKAQDAADTVGESTSKMVTGFSGPELRSKSVPPTPGFTPPVKLSQPQFKPVEGGQ